MYAATYSAKARFDAKIFGKIFTGEDGKSILLPCNVIILLFGPDYSGSKKGVSKRYGQLSGSGGQEVR
jgi:hypothetical protein